jgi:O-antigen/teichoic acid export membrane protein/glycosyltransferase involved in cell wall biosynthesis
MTGLATRAAVLTLTRLLNYGLMLISPVVLVHLLSVEQFGRYREFLLYASLLQLMAAFFIPEALLYFIAAHPASPWRLARHSACLTLGSSVLVASALSCIDLASHGAVVGALLWPLVGFTLFSANLDFWEPFWLATHRPVAVLAYSTSRLVARITVVTITAALTRDVSIIIWAIVALEGLRLGTSFVALLVLDRSAREPPVKAVWRSFLRYSLPSGAASVLSMLTRSATSFAVVRMLGAAALGEYTIGRFGEPIILSIRNSISTVVLPEMVRRGAEAALSPEKVSQESALALWQRATVINALFLFPISVIVARYAPPLVVAVFGHGYLLAATLLRIYMLGVIREVFDFAPCLRAVGKTLPLAYSNIAALVACAVSLCVLVPLAGVTGAMFSLVIAMVVDACYLARATMRAYGVSFRDLLPWTRIGKVALACALASLLLLPPAAAGSLAALVSVAINAAVYVAAVAVLVLALRVPEAAAMLRRARHVIFGQSARRSLRSTSQVAATEPPHSAPTPAGHLTISNECIVCFAGEDWWYHNAHSNKHLMEAFARSGNRVLFVNSTGIRAPSVLRDRYGWQRIGRKLRSLAIFLRRAEPNLFVLTPLAFPITRRLRRLVWHVNQILIVGQTRLVCALLGMSRPILWSACPASSAAAISMRRRWARLLVYYGTDNIAFFRGADTAFIKALDDALQARADISFFSGRKLFRERAQGCGATHLLSHGVDYSLFALAQHAGATMPPDMRALRQPIVGFIGVIASLDLDLLEDLARNSPHVSFVFIGRVLMDVSRMRGIPNVHFLGFKPYAQLPEYLRCFRCCMICYRRGDTFNDYRSPKKLLEYFASGLPIVSVTLSELDAYGPLVYQANTVEQFREQLQLALRECDPRLRQMRVDAAAARDWSVVAAEASRHIARCLERIEPGTVVSDQFPHSSA